MGLLCRRRPPSSDAARAALARLLLGPTSPRRLARHPLSDRTHRRPSPHQRLSPLRPHRRRQRQRERRRPRNRRRRRRRRRSRPLLRGSTEPLLPRHFRDTSQTLLRGSPLCPRRRSPRCLPASALVPPSPPPNRQQLLLLRFRRLRRRRRHAAAGGSGCTTSPFYSHYVRATPPCPSSCSAASTPSLRPRSRSWSTPRRLWLLLGPFLDLSWNLPVGARLIA